MKLSTLVFLFSIVSIALNAQVIYVKAGSQGAGSSWADASGNLSQALENAVAGQEVWVAAGTYTPTDRNDRHASFEVFDGVKVYGGFAGNETSLSQRDWVANKTILSGEIGSVATIDDNSYTVLYTRHASASTVVDGFTITKGAANGLGDKGDLETCGGAWFNDGESGKSNPTVSNCVFVENYGRNGGAVYNYAKEGACNPRIVNCQFINNKADFDGGAIYNDSRSGICNPVIKGCKLARNEATYGGGILNHSETGGEANPSISNCAFKDNLGYIKGGSIYASEEGGTSNPSIINSTFEDNKSTVGHENYDNDEDQVQSRGVLKKM